jgi:uncharacterized protein (DUF362 family)
VVAVATSKITGLRQLDASQAAHLVSKSICGATGESDAAAGIRKLFKTSDRVGIKVNCLAGRGLSPQPELVEALVQLIEAGGIPAYRIIVFERSSRELREAGFRLSTNGSGYRCHGIDNNFDRHVTSSGSIGSCYARLVSTECTALVSFGVVKDHDLAGVSAGLKNWYGVIHNPNKYHDNNCDPYVADVVRHPIIRDKLRLTVLDGIRAQCQGGPAHHPPAVFDLSRVAASVDPVAIDAWAWKVIDRERKRRGLPSLEEANRRPRFLNTAASFGLGEGDPSSIREVTV